jgi:hypothetical protein
LKRASSEEEKGGADLKLSVRAAQAHFIWLQFQTLQDGDDPITPGKRKHRHSQAKMLL